MVSPAPDVLDESLALTAAGLAGVPCTSPTPTDALTGGSEGAGAALCVARGRGAAVRLRLGRGVADRVALGDGVGEGVREAAGEGDSDGTQASAQVGVGLPSTGAGVVAPGVGAAAGVAPAVPATDTSPSARAAPVRSARKPRADVGTARW
ncbi:MAG TPA: hypothetical protein VMZ11_04055 [Mycobacteriales bacterium]|nr:hypothetical protein [Mycobacteriales bacterium]